MKTTYIYGIKDLEIDKYIYIGKSNEPINRYDKVGNSHNDCVKKFVEEKGEDNFRVEDLEEVKFKVSRDWIVREGFWIAKFTEEGHPLCNKNSGGSGVTEQTEEARAKQSRANLGRKQSEETRAKRSKALMGHEVSDETREKIRVANVRYNATHEVHWPESRDRTAWNKGKKCPQISEALMGHEVTEEARTKQSKASKEWHETHDNPMLGKHHTKEAKQIQSEKRKEWHRVNEHPRPSLGKHPTKETRDKIGIASAKPYPAFYNIKTEEFIPAGLNLFKLCQERGLSYDAMSYLKHNIHKQSKEGWVLADE